MFDTIPLGWLQLKHQKLRLLSAILGVTFAVVLIFVQLEFREALFVSAVRYHSGMEYDLVMVSPRTDYLLTAKTFPRNRLYQALGMAGVSDVTPIYSMLANWRNPVDPSRSRKLFALGFDPSNRGFEQIISQEGHEQIKVPYQVIFDSLSREEYGPVVELMQSNQTVNTEINDRAVTVTGLYAVGTSFGLDGGVITSDLNFLRFFPKRKKSAISLGLIHLHTGQDPGKAQARIQNAIPKDVLVLTPVQFEDMEKEYWNNTTPIGFVFAFGSVIGLIVGLIIVYQILFADVQDHLKEYATLGAMGYTPGYLRKVVLQEAAILAVLGFIPGLVLSTLIFRRAAEATGLPLEMSVENILTIFSVTMAMCAGSGLLTLRKLQGIDPAEVF
jgi:putative ABC transport system permease protein